MKIAALNQHWRCTKCGIVLDNPSASCLMKHSSLCSMNAKTLTAYEIRMILMEVTERKTRKTKFSGYNDIFCSGYRMALEDVLKIKRPKLFRSG